ncbi:MAG: type IV pilus assembly protein PilM [Actinobacteria bacterium]|nr:type IV pilus assembly protein PilM [Actinomycetota bacterium]
MSVIGLDIGTSAVRAAEVAVDGRRPALVSFGQVGLPPGAVIEGEITAPKIVADALERLWDKAGMSHRQVHVGIAGLRAILRQLELPWIPDEEVPDAVRYQSEEVIPFPAEKTVLSTRVVEDYTASDGSRMRRVLIAATHSDLIDSLLEALELARLKPVSIDLTSAALVRAVVDPLSDPRFLEDDRPEAIVSVGAGLTVVVIHKKGRPEFVRTVTMGGNAATEAIAATLNLPFSDAEELKRRVGLPVPQADIAQKALAPVTAELAKEVRNSLQYYASLPNGNQISRVVLTGGSAPLYGLVPALEEALDTSVDIFSPLARLDCTQLDPPLNRESASFMDPVIAAPVGLGLPEPIPSAKGFNLVPPSVGINDFVGMVQRIAVAVAIVIVIVLLGLSALKVLQVRHANSKIASLKTELSSIKSQIPQYNPVSGTDAIVAQQNSVVLRAIAPEVNWLDVLGQITYKTAGTGIAVTDFSGHLSSSSSSANAPVLTKPPYPPNKKTVLGQVTVNCVAPGPYFQSVATWIDRVNSSNAFTLPSVGPISAKSKNGASSAAAAAKAGEVTFSSTFDVTSYAASPRGILF